MPTPLNSERLLRILVGRHRKLTNLMYKQLLIEVTNGKNDKILISSYRGLINDLVSMLKEMREQEKHSKHIQFYDVFEEIDSMEGANFTDKVRKWAEKQPKQTDESEDIMYKILGPPEMPYKEVKKLGRKL